MKQIAVKLNHGSDRLANRRLLSHDVMPGMSRLFLDLSAGVPGAALPPSSLQTAQVGTAPASAHWPELVKLLAAQNPSVSAAPAIAALARAREPWSPASR